MYMHLHECIYMYTCIHIHAHAGKHLCAHTHMCTHMHSCTRICMHIQVCMYVHTLHWACLQGKSCCELGKHPSGCWVAISCAPPPLSHPLLRVSLPFPRKIQPWGGEGHTHTPPRHHHHLSASQGWDVWPLLAQLPGAELMAAKQLLNRSIETFICLPPTAHCCWIASRSLKLEAVKAGRGRHGGKRG